MFFSKSDFFKQSILILIDKKTQMINVLKYKTINDDEFIKAFDFFVLNPSLYDGATIVKDLKDIKGLDFSAMKHDYNYIVLLSKYNGFKWLKIKFKYDFQYGLDMERLGKGITIPYLRVLGLILSTPIYLAYKIISNIKGRT